MDVCPLCDKLSQLHQLPADETVWEFPHSVAFLGPWQYHTGYCVLVSRRHAHELFELPPEERDGLWNEMLILARAISDTFQPRKMNYEALGNQVDHPHWHLFPRRHDDPETLKAVWLGFERAESDPAEKQRVTTGSLSRTETIRQIREALNALKAPGCVAS